MAKPRSQFTRLGAHVARDTASEVRKRAATGEPSALAELEALNSAATPDRLSAKIWEIVRNHLVDSDGILCEAGGGPPKSQDRAPDAYAADLLTWTAQARERHKFDSPEGRAVEIVGRCAHIIGNLGMDRLDTTGIVPRCVPEWGTGVRVWMLRNVDIRWNEYPPEGRLTVNKGDALNTGRELADTLVRQDSAVKEPQDTPNPSHAFRLGVVLGYGLSQKNHLLVREFADGPALARESALQAARAEGGNARAQQSTERDGKIRAAFSAARADNPSLTPNGWASDHASQWGLSGDRVRKILTTARRAPDS